MWYLIFIVMFAYCLFYIWLEKNLRVDLYKNMKDEQRSLSKTYTELLEQEKELKQDLELSSKQLESTIGLYEVAKDVCKSLDEQEVFAIFRDKLRTNIAIEDCVFIKEPEIDDQLYKEDLTYKVKIDSKPVGFLIAKGVSKQEDRERFYILVQQFLLGLRRAIFYHQVQELSVTDSLTQMLNRRYFLERLNEEIVRSEKFDLKFSFLMADIDHFKSYNDRFGHLVGDIVLRETSKAIKENTRQIDLVGRYGGEEFSVLLPETPKEGAYLAAERIRKSLEDREIRAYDEELNVTISIGLCSFPEDAQTPSELIDKSDSALYEAKNKGRNKVCVFLG